MECNKSTNSSSRGTAVVVDVQPGMVIDGKWRLISRLSTGAFGDTFAAVFVAGSSDTREEQSANHQPVPGEKNNKRRMSVKPLSPDLFTEVAADAARVISEAQQQEHQHRVAVQPSSAASSDPSCTSLVTIKMERFQLGGHQLGVGPSQSSTAADDTVHFGTADTATCSSDMTVMSASGCAERWNNCLGDGQERRFALHKAALTMCVTFRTVCTRMP